jgi:hypothetical protein
MRNNVCRYEYKNNSINNDNNNDNGNNMYMNKKTKKE